MLTSSITLSTHLGHFNILVAKTKKILAFSLMRRVTICYGQTDEHKGTICSNYSKISENETKHGFAVKRRQKC